MNLTHKDYVSILQHYGKNIPRKHTKKNKRTKKGRMIDDRKRTRKLAEDLLAKKMCKCIKSVQKSFERRTRKNRQTLAKRSKTEKIQRNEGAAIGICRKSIFTQRGLDFNKFVCKKRAKLLSDFKTKYALQKLKKEIM